MLVKAVTHTGRRFYVESQDLAVARRGGRRTRIVPIRDRQGRKLTEYPEDARPACGLWLPTVHIVRVEELRHGY